MVSLACSHLFFSFVFGWMERRRLGVLEVLEIIKCVEKKEENARP